MDNDYVDKIGAPFLDQERQDMKVNKSQGLVYIFYMLLTNKQISKNDVLNELNITELSFWRYIQEIKAFICNFNIPLDVVYDRSNNVYCLVKKDLD